MKSLLITFIFATTFSCLKGMHAMVLPHSIGEHYHRIEHMSKLRHLLLYSAASGDVKAVETFVRMLAPIDACDERGETALYKAAANGHVEVVKYLLSQEANTDSATHAEVTPVHVAANNGHTVIVELINQQKALNARILKAASEGKADEVESLLDQGAYSEAILQSDDATDGMSPILLAAYYGHLNVVVLLLTYDKKKFFRGERLVNGGKVMHLANPLYWAAKKGHLEVVTKLLNCRADTEIDHYGGPLHAAAKKRHTAIVALLLKFNANPTALDCNGETPLSIAARKEFLDVMQLILAADNKQLFQNSHRPRLLGWQGMIDDALVATAYNGTLEAAKLLVANNGNCLATDDFNDTPLFKAGLAEHLDVCKFFLRTLALPHPIEPEILNRTRKMMRAALFCFKKVNLDRSASGLQQIPQELVNTILLSVRDFRDSAAIIFFDLLRNKEVIHAKGAQLISSLYIDQRCLTHAAWAIFALTGNLEQSCSRIFHTIYRNDASLTKEFFNSDNRSETIIPEIAKGLLERISQ